jgi:hypothetical protein
MYSLYHQSLQLRVAPFQRLYVYSGMLHFVCLLQLSEIA